MKLKELLESKTTFKKGVTYVIIKNMGNRPEHKETGSYFGIEISDRSSNKGKEVHTFNVTQPWDNYMKDRVQISEDDLKSGKYKVEKE